MMGIGTNNVVKVNFDMITPKELVDIIEKNHIFMIISTFDISEDGTVDTIDKFSKVCKALNFFTFIPLKT
jgi:glutamate/tyrosine decarboxylase-like PLP-dependent enzyme